MSFNPLMGLLSQAVVPLCGGNRTVLEFGNQTLTVDRSAMRRIIDRAAAHGQDVEGLRAIDRLSKTERRDQVANFYRHLGATSYTAIDVNDTYGSLVMDLNRDVGAAYQYRETFDLVTNSGTGEHIFDQGAVFRNAHQLTEVGGLMIHVMPFVNYVNHGFYSFHPNLYHALASANRYQILGLGIATRDGRGIISIPNQEAPRLSNFLSRGPEVEIELLLTEPKVPRRRLPHGWIESLAARMPGASRKQRFGLHVHRLLVHARKILVFAILKKSDAADFVVPIQLRYADDVQGDAL